MAGARLRAAAKACGRKLEISSPGDRAGQWRNTISAATTPVAAAERRPAFNSML
jgi:hypothetical protein